MRVAEPEPALAVEQARRRGRPPPGGDRHSELAAAAWPPGLLAAVALVALAAVYAVALGTRAGLSLDTSAIGRLDPGSDPQAYEATSRLLHTIDVQSLAVLGGGIIALALVRGKLAHALAAAAVLGGANVTTQVLKPLLGKLDPLGAEPARELSTSFPSGHATVAMSVGLALVLVLPPWLRAAAALVGGGYAAAVGVSLMALTWHYPSDVAGGYLVAASWAAVAAGGLRLAAARRGRRVIPAARRRADPVMAVLLAVAIAVAFATAATVAVLRRPELADYARLHTRFFLAAGAVAALSAALSVAVAAVVHRWPGAARAG